MDHALTLIPDHDGIYTVLATVTTGSADAAVSRSFVIPIVVGTAAAVANAPPQQPRKTARSHLTAENRDPITRARQIL